MTKESEYGSIGKMTHIPTTCTNRGHGWFYRRPGIGRLMEEIESFDTYERSIPEHHGYHVFDLVHVIMLTEEGIIPKEIGVQLLNALQAMESEGIDEARVKAGGRDHSGEAYLIQRLGWDIGGYIHAGRSSNDLAPTYQRIQQRHFLLEVAVELNNLRETLLNLAVAHVGTILPMYTALQHARPMTLAFFFHAFVSALERDFERLELAYKHTNTSAMGSADGTGSDFPLNLQRTAELAGFDGVFNNALDNYMNTDIEQEAFALLRTITDATARIGEKIQRWCSHEFRMAEMADRYCGTSSIMSQKKNPRATHLVNAANEARARDIFRQGFEEAVRGTINSLRYTRGILETTTWHKERMRELCEQGFTCNASLCRILVVEKGLPWRTAHQITAIMTRQALEKGMQMQDVTPELLDDSAIEYVGYGKPLNLSREQLEDAWNIEKNVMNQKTQGGTAPDRVKEQILKSQETLKRDRRSVQEKKARVQAAAEKRGMAISALMAN